MYAFTKREAREGVQTPVKDFGKKSAKPLAFHRELLGRQLKKPGVERRFQYISFHTGLSQIYTIPEISC
jgi:hypothetical protein